ncbi:MAG: hypothetical protein J6W37_02035, partial [Bacteroidales bacterium]|nr:hypothetical protein [Bacteroidales bacterium]
SGHYKNGKPDGEWYIYDTNGKLIQERYYKNGLEEGDWKYWRTYYYGEENEIYEETYNNGEIKSCRHSRDSKSFVQFENMEEPFNKIHSRYGGDRVDSSFWKSNDIYTHARLYKSTYERQDYSHEIIYKSIYEDVDSVICKHHNTVEYDRYTRREKYAANYVLDEFLVPYYLKIERKKINEDVYTVTFYDKDGNIFHRWQQKGYPDDIEKIIKLYMMKQKELENK